MQFQKTPSLRTIDEILLWNNLQICSNDFNLRWSLFNSENRFHWKHLERTTRKIDKCTHPGLYDENQQNICWETPKLCLYVERATQSGSECLLFELWKQRRAGERERESKRQPIYTVINILCKFWNFYRPFAASTTLKTLTSVWCVCDQHRDHIHSKMPV